MSIQHRNRENYIRHHLQAGNLNSYPTEFIVKLATICTKIEMFVKFERCDVISCNKFAREIYFTHDANIFYVCRDCFRRDKDKIQIEYCCEDEGCLGCSV